jgi:hypothetical protein
MYGKHWYHELKDAGAFWLACLIFILVGITFVAAGVWVADFFLFIGIPFLGLGILIFTLLIYSLHLKLKCPENYKTWLWWINFIGGVAGVLTFSIPSMLALPILLLLGWDSGGNLLIGVVFLIVGLLVTVGAWVVGRNQYRKRPRWVTTDKPADEE